MFFKKLFLSYTMIIIIGLLFLAIIIGNVTTKTIYNQAEKNTEHTLNEAVKNISGLVQSVEDVSLSICANRQLQYKLSTVYNESAFDIEEEIREIRNNILYPGTFNRNYDSVQIYAANKEKYPKERNMNDVMSIESIKNQSSYYNTAKLNGHFYWFLSNDFGYYHVSVMKLIKDVKVYTENLGIIEININCEKFDSMLNDINSEQTGRVYLIDENETIMSPSNEVGKSFNDNYKIKSKNKEGIEYIGTGNDEKIIVYKTIPETNWKLVEIIYAKELKKSGDYIIKIIYGTAIISIIIAALISFYLSYNLSTPIIKLSKTMESVKSGNLNLQVDSTLKKGELKILYDSFNYMIKMINKLINDVYVSRIKKREAELKALQAQINPHFLYNTLNSINWLAVKYDNKDISKMVTSLASILRYSLSKDGNIVAIRYEIEQIKSYITIQKMRFSDRFCVEYEIDEEILDYKIIKLILQPLVENAIIHGIENYDGIGQVIIKGYKDKNNIIFEVMNNGVTIDMDKVNKLLNNTIDEIGPSSGIINVNERLKLHYSNEYGLKYYVINDYTVAKVCIPT